MPKLSWSRSCKSANQPKQHDAVQLDDLSDQARPPVAGASLGHEVQAESELNWQSTVILAGQQDEQPNTHASSSSRGRFRLYHIIDATSADIRDLFGEWMDHPLMTLLKTATSMPNTIWRACLTKLALERTWLAYNRTANTLVSHSIVVAQLWILHEGQRTVGRVCASVMIVGGILVDLLGAVRYLQQCRAILDKDPSTGNGRAIGGSHFIFTSGIIFGFVCCGLFVLLLVVS